MLQRSRCYIINLFRQSKIEFSRSQMKGALILCFLLVCSLAQNLAERKRPPKDIEPQDDQIHRPKDAQETFAKITARELPVYELGKIIFDGQFIIGDYCERCRSLKYYAFRIGNKYLTESGSFAQWQTASSPNTDQLFQGIENADKTWSFRSLSSGKYLRALGDGSTINFISFHGYQTRWYIERHGAHAHIQSGQYVHKYWINSGSQLKQSVGASSLIVEYWPSRQWGWNF